MESPSKIREALSMMTGTTQYHRFSPIPGFPVATDGAVTLADMAGAFWLLDAIGSHQSNRRLDPYFQAWKLVVKQEDDSAVLSGYNDEDLVVAQKIPYTDFPLDSIELWLIDGIIMLPSEY